ncbi:hypothetical protein [Shewanella sp. cp20]|uniref:hypothetical protein n=1 Tax=Shewanella sp. cp20 TaxID=1521167 RepID=UPI0005A08779|nr:hypothetical protein [Shewanella sp. cp20]
MAKVNLSKAAALVGKNRTTIWRHVKSGKVSIERDRDGNPLVDTSELIRVYGELKPIATPESEKKQHQATPDYEALLNIITELKNEQKEMRKQIENLTNRLTHNKSSNDIDNKESTDFSTIVLAPENDPDWPKEVKTLEDIQIRNEIRSKYQSNQP